MLPIQPGDVIKTYADIEPMCKIYSYKPAIGINWIRKAY